MSDKISNPRYITKLTLKYYEKANKYLKDKYVKGKPKFIRGVDKFLIEFNTMYQDNKDFSMVYFVILYKDLYQNSVENQTHIMQPVY